MMLRIAAMIACGVAMAGCGANTVAVETRPLGNAADLPPNYRQLIVEKIKTSFFDPYSIRDAAISEPFVRSDRMTVCVRANAKNRMGGYTGVKDTAYYFRGGALTLVDDEFGRYACDGARYGPFAEIDSKPNVGGAESNRRQR